MANTKAFARLCPPKGHHGFRWNIPPHESIDLPYPLPGPANSAAYWMAAENIVAAYNAGKAAAAAKDEPSRARTSGNDAQQRISQELAA